MDWIMENGATLFSVASLAAVALVWLYVRYWRDQELLWADVRELLADGLEFLKSWAGDALEGVTEADVGKVAEHLYMEYIAGTALAKVVSIEYFYALLWDAFVAWRDRFVTTRACLVRDL